MIANLLFFTVIMAPEPDSCSESKWGCCSDGLNFADGPDGEGCPDTCKCHPIGTFQFQLSFI